MKTCRGCGLEKPRSAFYPDKRASDGLVSRCRVCRAAESRARYATEEYKRYARERQRKKRSTSDGLQADREALRRWREENRLRYVETYQKYNAAYYAASKAAGKGKRRRDPAKHLANENRRRARLMGSQSPGVTPQEWMEIVEAHGALCAYCGARAKLTRDHVVPLSRGGRDEPCNVVPACQPCNSSKKNKLLSEWLRRSPTNEAQSASSDR